MKRDVTKAQQLSKWLLAKFASIQNIDPNWSNYTPEIQRIETPK